MVGARKRNASPKGNEAASGDNDNFNDTKIRSMETMELYFQGVEKAAETWKIVQQIPNYEGVAGELLFRQ
jgi:hypothetical protein